MMYQGHLNDGSSVQKHSAGGIYPLIVGKYERAIKPWFVMSPDGSETYCDTGVQAYDTAESMLNLRTANRM
jgi:hypothetical protein